MANIVEHSQIRYVLEKRLSESWPEREWCDSHVLLGVSGGPDSVAMLRAMASLKAAFGGDGKLLAGHLNHGMRGSEADADEAWLGALCERLGVPLVVGKTDVSAIVAEQGDGWEAAARSARYEFLRQTAERIGARFVVTAHTADDQVETVLHRILRGTGLEGLTGMPGARQLSASVALVRPLLTVRRCEVLEYIAAIGQDFRTDASNQDIRWTRNRLRNDLLPQLRERYNPKVDEALERLAAQAKESQHFLAGLADNLARDCLVVDRGHVQIDCSKLLGQPAILLREVCKIAWREVCWSEQSMGFNQWQQLAALAEDAGLQPVNLPGNIRARREEQFLILDRLT